MILIESVIYLRVRVVVKHPEDTTPEQVMDDCDYSFTATGPDTKSWTFRYVNTKKGKTCDNGAPLRQY